MRMDIAADRFYLPAWMIALLFVGIAVFVFMLFIGLILRHLRIRRQYLHEERMKAIELGRSLEPSPDAQVREKAVHNAFWIAFWVGAFVPIASVIAAAVVVSNNPALAFAFGVTIWLSVGAIGVAGVVSAAVMIMVSGRGTARQSPITLPPAVPTPQAAPSESAAPAPPAPPSNRA